MLNKMDFMNTVKDIFEETKDADLVIRAEQMKNIIDQMLAMELEYMKNGIR